MKQIVAFLTFFFFSLSNSAQIGLPIQQSVLPKNSLVVNYDFSNTSSYIRGSTTVSNISGTGNGSVVSAPIFMNSLGFISFNSFNGTDQYLISPNVRTYFKSLNSSVQRSFSMSLWVYPTSLNGVIVSEHESQTLNSGFFTSNIELVNGVVRFKVWNGTVLESTPILSNQWHHIAMVYNGTSLKGFVNGILQGIQSYDRTIPPGGQFYGIGSQSNTNMGSGAFGKFHLAQFKLHNLPLSDNEVKQEYDLRKTEFDYTIHSPSTNSSPTYWGISSAWNSSTGSTGSFDPFGFNHYTPWLNSGLGWAAQALDANQWITLNYDEPAFLKGVVIQGRLGGWQLVTKAHVETSLTGSAPWTRILSNINVNNTTNPLDDVRLDFPNNTFAKTIRLLPTEYSNHITLRMGMLVKPNNYINDGLVIRLDPANIKSYQGTGVIWNDVNSISYPFTLTYGPTYSNNGFFDFDGTNDFAVRTHTSQLKPTTSITIEQWLSADNWNAGASNNYKTSLSCTQGGGYSHNIWNGDFYSYIFAGGGYRIPTADVSNIVGWHHFVTSFDGRYTRLYVDGELKSTVDIGTSGNIISYASNGIFIGAEAASSNTTPEGFYWDGKIGLTSIYNRALTAAEISQNYNAIKPRYEIDKDLVMDLVNPASTGTTWIDQSGNGNNGTLIGSPTYVSTNGGGYRTSTGQYVSTNYNLPNTFTISIVASLNPTSFWASFWGNEVFNSSTGYLAYFNSTTGLNIGSPTNLSSFAVSGISAIHIWDFVVNGNSVTLYMDGVSLGTKTFSSPVGLATNGLYFGARHTNAGTSFTDVCPGTYYNMRVYKRDLSASEISTKFSYLRGNYGL
jgi:hypothetical protein